MTSLALRGILHRPLRAFFTALAVVLGVALVAGALILSGSIRHGFDDVFASTYAQTDAVVRGERQVDYSATGRATVPAALLQRVRALPEVDQAAGQLIDFSGDTDLVRIYGPDGRRIETPGTPAFGLGLDTAHPNLSPFALKDGRWARGAGEVVVDAGTASRNGIEIGERIRVAGDGAPVGVTVVGLIRLGSVDSIGSAAITVFDVPTAQALHAKDGFDAIWVTARDGVSDAELTAALRTVLPTHVGAETAAQAARADGESVADFTSFVRWFLVALGGVSLLVGAFVIFNTFTITVAQRTRELGTMRALGASRRQVVRLMATEALLIGLLASVVGIGAGVGLVAGLGALLEAFGLDMPRGGSGLTTGSVVIPMLLGTVVTILAGIVPALRASRVAPIAAIRHTGRTSGPRSRRLDVATALVLAAAAGLVGVCVAPDGPGLGARVVSLIAGLGLLFVGIGMAAPRLAGPLARLIGVPARRLGGVPGDLAQSNARLNPARTAATAVALTVGLVLVGFVAVFGHSLKTSVNGTIAEQIRTPYVVSADQYWLPVPNGVTRALTDAPGVTGVSAVRRDRARAAGDDLDVTGIDPATIDGAYRFTWAAAPSAPLGPGQAAVTQDFADAHDLGVGGRFPLTTPDGRTVRLTVAGISTTPGLYPILGQVTVSRATFDAAFPRPRDGLLLVDAGTRDAVAAAVTAHPDVDVATPGEYAGLVAGDIDAIIGLIYVLLALSVVVALIGMATTLALSVHERTREIGTLRAIGLTRHQVRRMVRVEAVMTALVGAVMGLPVGVALGAVVANALADDGVSVAIPSTTLAAFLGVAVLAGMLAAVTPARRAARLRPSAALQYE